MFFDIYKDLCSKNKTSPSKVATELGFSNSIATKWKKTGATPDSKTLSKIADYFNVSIEYLLGTENEKSPAGNDANGAIPGFDELSEANQAIVRSMIDQLLAAQSNQ